MTRRTLSNVSGSVAVLLACLVCSSTATAQYEDVAYGSTFSDAFDWTLSGLWAADATPIQGPGSGSPNSINFNNAAGNYTGFNTGTARSPVIDAGEAGWHHLHFGCRYDTDTTGTATDRRWLRILEPVSGTVLYTGQFAGTGGNISCSTYRSWHSHTIDVSPYTSQYLQFEFYFDSVDANGNAGTGWFIDNFIIHIDDLAPPDAIASLAATLRTDSIARVTWTSPWDRLQTLQAGSEFDLRYSTAPITDVNWDYTTSHRVLNEPNTGQPGASHAMDVAGLEKGKAYYFAIRTIDTAGNVSPLSNIATLDTQGSPPPPGPEFDDGSKSQGYLTPECSAGRAAGPGGFLFFGALAMLAAAAPKRAQSTR